jgi:hypothetical protein
MFTKIKLALEKFLRQTPEEAFLNKATDISDLENRIRVLQYSNSQNFMSQKNY